MIVFSPQTWQSNSSLDNLECSCGSVEQAEVKKHLGGNLEGNLEGIGKYIRLRITSKTHKSYS